MTLLFHGQVDTVRRMSNLTFWRKVITDRLATLAGGLPFTLFGFQENPSVGTDVTNEGSSGAPGDMALTDAAMWSGQGWYQSFGRPAQAGMKGLGLRGVGGVSTYHGVIPIHSGTSAAAKRKYTWIYKFIMNGTGGGGGGRLSEASASHICFASGANTLAMSLYDGGAWASNTTGANIVYGYPHTLVVVFDGTLAGDTNRLKLYLDCRDVTVSVTPGITDTLVDPSSYTAILNGQVAGWTRACDGELGLFASLPGVALTLAEIQSLEELKGAFQVTPANQPQPTASPNPKYAFTWANLRHFVSFQIHPLLTTTGSIITVYEPNDFVNEGTLMGVCQNGVNGDYLLLKTRGDIVNDPMELMGGSGGIADLRLQHALGTGNAFARHCSVITSDGILVRAYFDGNLQALAPVIGANTGQWFASYPLATAFVIGADRAGMLSAGFGGLGSEFMVYDRCVAHVEVQQMLANRFRRFPEA